MGRAGVVAVSAAGPSDFPPDAGRVAAKIAGDLGRFDAVFELRGDAVPFGQDKVSIYGLRFFGRNRRPI